jgi:hypothetical protein
MMQQQQLQATALAAYTINATAKRFRKGQA